MSLVQVLQSKCGENFAEDIFSRFQKRVERGFLIELLFVWFWTILERNLFHKFAKSPECKSSMIETMSEESNFISIFVFEIFETPTKKVERVWTFNKIKFALNSSNYSLESPFNSTFWMDILSRSWQFGTSKKILWRTSTSKWCMCHGLKCF